MVVILLLSSASYTANNGCDGGSNDSNTSTTSTTSTGETAIPTTTAATASSTPQQQQTLRTNPNPTDSIESNTTISTARKTKNNNNKTSSSSSSDENGCLSCSNPESSQNYIPATDYSWRCYVSSEIPAESQQATPYHIYYRGGQGGGGGYIPPYQPALPLDNILHQYQTRQAIEKSKSKFKSKFKSKSNSKSNFINPSTPNATSDIVRHVTRVNFYDIDTLQVEFEPKHDDDDDNNCDTEAITKEEEIITKRKTELTTTRQIETRVQRQVVLEDGKVVEDSGPIVSTNTTEDTDKQESETTEKRDLGIPTESNVAALDVDDVDAVRKDRGLSELANHELAVLNSGDGKAVVKMVPRPADGLVREINDKRVISHEEKKDYLETEAIKHFGDFSDQTYVNAVNSGVENIEEVLLSPESKQQLVPLGPRIVANTTKSFKTIDSEDVEKRCLAQDDGKIITEKKTTTEHEVILDKDLSEKDDQSTGSREKITTVEASQRFFKKRDEQNVDLVVDGKVVGTEMRYAAETMQMEKEGSLERPGDWDSLSDRMRKMRRQQHKTLMQQHKEAALLADRKDALTKRPLDFDREEETRKGETMKWLESHFGSESTASNDSREDDAAVEPTKKTYFNVTIKSTDAQHAAPQTVKPYERQLWEDRSRAQIIPTTTAVTNGKTKYYQGISNWNERREPPHFASQAFRDDLRETIERNNLRKGNIVHVSREKLNDNGRYLVEPNDTYVSREDILQQKRQSLSSQFLARTKRASRENLNEIDTSTLRRNLNINDSRGDLRYNRPSTPEENKRVYMNGGGSTLTNTSSMKRSDYIDTRAKSYERMSTNETSLRYDDRGNTSLTTYTLEEEPQSTQTLGRPTVPQRRRAIERKIRQQSSSVVTSSPQVQKIVPSETQRNGHIVSSNRSRSTTPPNDYDLNEQPPPSAATTKHTEHNKVPSTEHTNSTSTLTKKQIQRTRFAPTTILNGSPRRSNLPTQTVQTQTTPASNISTSTTASHKSNRVGTVIGNSLRKLVNKIRSASAERKMRMKSKSKSRDHSPSFDKDQVDKPTKDPTAISTTYQQYNVIDSHIGGQPTSNESEQESSTHHRTPSHRKESNAPITMNGTNKVHIQSPPYKTRATSADPYTNESDVQSPRQRYYLGEDPYSSTLYGQENHYDPMNRNNNKTQYGRTHREHSNSIHNQRSTQQSNGHRYGEGDSLKQRNMTTHTLGRYPKGRITESTPNLNHDYRSTQTLPRKLRDSRDQGPPQQQYGYHKMTQRSATTLNGGHNNGTLIRTERRPSMSQHNSSAPHHQLNGPAKPARTYAKALNRSKSFNVHGMNGTNDPSPIYIEKLTRNNYTNSNLKQSQGYKSNPMLNSGLKSPSIVNLISRSQKDLTKIGTKDETTDSDAYAERKTYIPTNYVPMQHSTPNHHTRPPLDRDEKKQIFLKDLHERAPDLYRTLEGGNDYATKGPTKYQLQRQRSADTRSPIEINKDTASIFRRGSSSNEDYVQVPSYPRKGYVSTIVEVRK